MSFMALAITLKSSLRMTNLAGYRARVTVSEPPPQIGR
jgi:hypothetical protein